MADIKTQFSQLRTHVPKHVQWLLLIAAFIIVLILLTLVMRDNSTQEIKNIEKLSTTLTIIPDSIDWTGTKVGDTQKQEIIVSSNMPVKIDDVRLEKNKDGLSQPKTTCKTIGVIADKIYCTITVEYKPKKSDGISAVPLFIDWRGADQPENMNKTDKIVIALGAEDIIKKEITPITEQTVQKENKTEFQSELEEITQTNSDDPNLFEKENNTAKENKKITNKQSAAVANIVSAPKKSEACSNFSFVGYDTAGKQFGWIKPTGGSYKFHPFSDKNCDSATGIYNPDTGIITDINDYSKRIGTDAEHIGYSSITNNTIPQLSNPVSQKKVNRAKQLSTEELVTAMPAGQSSRLSALNPNFIKKTDTEMLPSSNLYGKQSTVASKPYDRTFVLRQYKPIPATIVSEIRAVANETRLPVTATVDRNVYSDNGRTIVIPAGTMVLGSVSDSDLPGPYKSIGRVNIDWYRFVRPDGVEFNFTGEKPFSADAQGRTGVPGRGSTDYMEQFIMPMLTAIVPAAVNMIAPISDKFVNQIDLDSNTVTTSGQVKSSELAKQEIISTWNTVAQKLLVDTIDNTVPPFSIASGTRITIFSPNDLIVTCGEGTGKKCSIAPYATEYAATVEKSFTVGVKEPETLVGQVRSFNMDEYCSNGKVNATAATIQEAGYDYRTVEFYCQSSQYQAKNNAKQEAVYENQKTTSLTTKDKDGNTTKMTKGSTEYNQQVLGLKYNDDGTIQNPFNGTEQAPAETADIITCDGGTAPNENGCCPGEDYDNTITNPDDGSMGVCCPEGGGDCFPPIK